MFLLAKTELNVVTLLLLHFTCILGFVYLIDDAPGLGRTFDGIGGLSAGASSRLLINYPEPYRSQILDFLFKPNFGASLHICKVEIGGDSQSTDGTEASHMHTPTDENYFRGYEWWLMKEAKKRNDKIKLYGLPWAFPAWLGNGTQNPYINTSNLVLYTMKWIDGAKKYHNLTIDYIGIWNERIYNIPYIKMLRQTLDGSSYKNVRIVAADLFMSWEPLVTNIINDPELSQAIDIIGVHYTGTKSPDNALRTDKKLWGSEEYSTTDDLSGGACWARILSEGYVNGHITGIISWSLIASYYDALPFFRNGLMTANTPWSGYYDVSSPIWTSAHLAQFAEIGWHYFKHSFGAGILANNGTYISLTSPDKNQLTVVITTIDPAYGHCFYTMPKYTIKPQKATFKIGGSFMWVKELFVWYSKFDTAGGSAKLFVKKAPIRVLNGVFTIDLDVNEVYTLTTVNNGYRGSHSVPPPNMPFPITYKDDFQTGYSECTEPRYFSQQGGVFEVVKMADTDNNAVKQTITEVPVNWCTSYAPITLIGNSSWSDVFVQTDFMVPAGGTSGVFLAARINKGGCNVHKANGIYVWLDYNNHLYMLTGSTDGTEVYNVGELDVLHGKWYTLGLYVQTIRGGTETNVIAKLNQKVMFNVKITRPTNEAGFVAVGMKDFGVGYFDNFYMSKVLSPKKLPSMTYETNNINVHGNERL